MSAEFLVFTSHALIPYAGYGHNVVNTEAGGEIRKGGVEREQSSSVSAGTSTCEPISIIRTTEFPFTVKLLKVVFVTDYEDSLAPLQRDRGVYNQ